MAASLPDSVRKEILKAQKTEITEHRIYTRLAGVTRNKENSEILKKIGEDELHHHDFWFRYTGQKVRPNRWKVFFYYWLARILGLTFGIKLMEQGEEKAQINYQEIVSHIPMAGRIIEEEESHEQTLIKLINEEHLNYVGSMVLGLNDALVELTGTLAGLSFALQDTRVIALSGLITGIAASFSMAASEYLSNKSDGNTETAITSSFYTGIAYVLTVVLLILPYFLFSSYVVSLTVTLATALLIIFCFSFYVAVVKDLPFRKRFLEMAVLSLSVALISFMVGYVIRITLGVEI